MLSWGDLCTGDDFAFRQGKNARKEGVYAYTPQGGTEVNDRLSTAILGLTDGLLKKARTVTESGLSRHDYIDHNRVKRRLMMHRKEKRSVSIAESDHFERNTQMLYYPT
jgi:hypothetical protein